MNQTFYIIIFFAVLTPLGLIFYFLRQAKAALFYRLSVANFLKRQYKKSEHFYFDSQALRNAVLLLTGKYGKEAEQTLDKLQKGQPQKAAEYFEKRKYFGLAERLKAFGSKALAEKVLAKIRGQESGGYCRAVKLYYAAQDMIKEGILKEASENLSEAIKLFEKEKAYFEVMRTYILLGTIYRVTTVYDTAQFMFEAVHKMAGRLGIPSMEADALGNLGMLMAAQERFEEAENFFEKALQINNRIKRLAAAAEIVNQQALLMLLNKKNKAAKSLAAEAIGLNQKNNNKIGQALGWDIISFINQDENKFSELAKTAGKAMALYDKERQFDAWLEAYYMRAFAFYKKDKLDEAEKMLREITKEAEARDSCFHVANAYNMLGLIFMQREDAQRAKGLFQKAAQIEERNERFCGAATDYANIAIIEKKSGQTEQARKTLELAIGYAKAYEKTDLLEMLEKQIERINRS